MGQLSAVLETLGRGFVRAVGKPPAGSVPPTDVVLFDSLDSLDSVTSGSIVLGIGVRPDGDDALSLVEVAGEREAAAVVLRADPPFPKRLMQLAAGGPVAVLALSSAVRWEQAHLLLRAAVFNAGPFDTGTALPVGDLFALADAIAESVGGPSLIADPDWKILAYSNLDFEIDDARRDAILARTPTPSSRRRIAELGLMRVLRSSDEVVRWTDQAGGEFVERLTASVRAGDELLGVVTVAEAGSSLGPGAERELARVAKLAAVHLLSHRTAEDVRRKTRAAFLREVLEGWAPSSPSAMMRTAGPLTVFVFALEAQHALPRGLSRERILGLVSLHCESRHPEAVCSLIDERIWAVVPTHGADHREATMDLATKIVDEVEASTSARLCAAIGTTVTGVARVPTSRRAAEQAFAVLSRLKGRSSRIVHIADVGAHAGLLQVIDWASGNDEIGMGKLERLRAHDDRRGTSYLKTLRAYLDAWGDIPAAAELLCVHRNTLRHRLARLVDVSGLDLADPEERLMTELQLRIAAQGGR